MFKLTTFQVLTSGFRTGDPVRVTINFTVVASSTWRFTGWQTEIHGKLNGHSCWYALNSYGDGGGRDGVILQFNGTVPNTPFLEGDFVFKGRYLNKPFDTPTEFAKKHVKIPNPAYFHVPAPPPPESPPIPPPKPTPPPPPTDGTTPPPPTDGTIDYTYTKIGEVTIKNVEQLNNLQDWNATFKAGDYGLANFNFPIPVPDSLPTWMKVMFPYLLITEKIYGYELSKAGISDYMNSYLPSKGVQLWRSVYWNGNTLCIPFITGVAPLIILAIAAGVALIAGVLSITISLYKLGVHYVTSMKEKELEGQENILQTISNIQDPDLQAEALLKYLGMTGIPGGSPNESVWFGLFQKPILILTIVVAIAVVALVAIKMIRR